MLVCKIHYDITPQSTEGVSKVLLTILLLLMHCDMYVAYVYIRIVTTLHFGPQVEGSGVGRQGGGSIQTNCIYQTNLILIMKKIRGNPLIPSLNGMAQAVFWMCRLWTSKRVGKELSHRTPVQMLREVVMTISQTET